MKSNNKISGLANIDERTLFLNIYSKIDKDNEEFNNVYDWFVNANYLDLGNPRFEDFINTRISLKILSDEKYKKELLRFIKTFDSGIEGIKTTPDSIEEVQNNNRVVKVELIHRGENNELKALPLELESNGTRKMFHLFDFFMDALRNGMVLFIDELDAKLHPLLTRYIINLFHNSETNVGNGQIIYSTHDTVNLNKDTFRRDEIWFTEKNRDGVSEMYALSDYIGCMSPANVKYVIEHNPEIDSRCVEVCPNSIELLPKQEKIESEAMRLRYGISPNKTLCIYGGNIGKPQGIDFLINTIESNEKRDNCFFLIVGDGTEYKKLEHWFQMRKPTNANLLSSLPKMEYDQLISSADIGLIYLYRQFTIPNYPSRLLSYLENAIPIMMAVDLNTDIGRIAEENGYGYWVESGDLDAFDKKLDFLLENPIQRKDMGLRGYEFLKSNYTVDRAFSIIMSHFTVRK